MAKALWLVTSEGQLRNNTGDRILSSEAQDFLDLFRTLLDLPLVGALARWQSVLPAIYSAVFERCGGLRSHPLFAVDRKHVVRATLPECRMKGDCDRSQLPRMMRLDARCPDREILQARLVGSPENRSGSDQLLESRSRSRRR
jgi:hypothetical protein